MKKIIHSLIAIAVLSFGLSANAQDVTGSNLNIGSNNVIATGLNAGSAIGSHLRVFSNFSLAIGYGDTLTQKGGNSLVVGGANKMDGAGSISVGLNNQVFSDYSVGFGRYVKTSAQEGGCMAIGVGLYGTQTRPALYMENQYDNSLMVGFLSTQPTFTVGPAYTDYFSNGTITDRTGKIAIGDVPIPDIAAKLHIRADEDEDAGIILESKDPESSTFIRMRDEYHGIEVDEDGITTIKSLALGYNATEIKRPLLLKGVVGVNVPEYHRDDLTNAYALWVSGGVIAEKVTIKTTGAWWSDYVFNPDYPLMPTGDLREYIGANRHLPDVPSEAEVMENGIELGGMQSILLKKIEELTLYMLRQQETIDRLETRIAELEDK